jgi:tetratricopeptide (TPR) repeat protein
LGKRALWGSWRISRRTANVSLLWGRCWEGEETPAFWPWIQIFRTMMFNADPNPLVGMVPDGPFNAARIVQELEGFPALNVDAPSYPPSDQARFRLFDAATILIREAVSSGPVVLILEDLHEADRSSLLLLEFLARQLYDLRVLMLATYREPEGDLKATVRDLVGIIAGRGHRIRLAGLRRDETGEFLSRGFDISLSAESVAAVHAGTGGNPFFLDELARRLVSERQLESIPGGGLEVPEGLRIPIRNRLAALPPDAQALLSLASVIGREFSFELLLAASGLDRDALLTTLGGLAALRFVDPAGFALGPYRFVHALVRETIYQDLPDEQRWRLHRRVGQAIETLDPFDLDRYLDHLAHHFSEAAALGEIDRAIEYSQRAAQRATRQFGYDEAIGHYQRTLELAHGAAHMAAKRFELLLLLGDAQWWAGHISEASATFQSAASLARQLQNPHWLAEAALRVGEVGYGGAYMQAWSFDPAKVELLDEALAALGDEETLVKVRVMARLSTALYFSPFDSMSRRDTLSRDAVELARILGNAQTLAYALNARHLAVWGPDNVEDRLALATEVVELARQAGNVALELTGHVWRLADLLEMGEGPGTDLEIGVYQALAETIAYPQFLAYASMFRAIQAMLRGQFADAETFAQRSLALGDKVGDINIRLSHHVQMAALRALQGRVEETADYVKLVAGWVPYEIDKMHVCFRCLAGDRSGTEQAFSAIWHGRHGVPSAFWLSTTMGMALLAANATPSQEAVAIYDQLRPYERRWVLAGRDVVAPLGPVAYYLGLLAANLSRIDDAAGHFEVALEAAERIGSRPYLALAQGAYGAMLAHRDTGSDRRRATQLLADARKIAEELGMKQLCDEVVAAQAGLPAGARTEQMQPDASAEDSAIAAVFRSEGEYWTIDFQRTVVRIRDAKGLHYLRRLLAAPGREFHVLDLAAGPTPLPHRTPSQEFEVTGADGEKLLDPAAKAAYRARIEELRQDVAEAEEHHDLERAARARAEMDFIVAELARAVGWGGRDRKAASPGERARSAVSKSLRACLKRIENAHPVLGAHLATTIRTGYFCSYKPELPIKWQI